MDELKLKFILFMVAQVLRGSIKKYEVVRKHVGDKRVVVQVKLRDGSIARYYEISLAGVKSKAVLHDKPDVVVDILDVETALAFLNPNADQGEIIHAMKNFRVLLIGPDHLAVWFAQLMNLTSSAKLTYGTKMPDGTTRFTSNTNGGPLFIYVKDDKIVRVTPIDLDESDAPSWTIKARGKSFSPDRRVSINPHAQTLKSMIYSDKRILYPMKRVDFDPNGERNPQNRGKSGYVRISWDEALDMVANEIKRQRQVYGPGALAIWHGSHHQWGNVGYYLSALLRFGNLLGFTRVHHNPDSWEGWYWGATHHYGNSMRVGVSGFYGLVEDCLKEAEMIVFWSSDPESTNGYASGYEGTKRRMWAKELGIEMVHIDPNFNPTAQLFGGRWIPIKPGTDPALSIAIMNVWINEGLYDKDYVANRTTGFEEWRDYVLGVTDGVPKTPEWQEAGNGRSRSRRPRTCTQMGQEENLSRRGWPRHGFWGRLPQRDRRAMGPLLRHDDVDARPRKAWRQFRQSAIWHTARQQLLVPRLRRRRHLRRAGVHCRGPAHLLPHAAYSQHEPGQTNGAAPAAPRCDHQRIRKGLPVGWLLATRHNSRPTNIPRPAIRRSICSIAMEPQPSARSPSQVAIWTCSGTSRSTWSSTSRSGWRVTRISRTSSFPHARLSRDMTSARSQILAAISTTTPTISITAW